LTDYKLIKFEDLQSVSTPSDNDNLLIDETSSGVTKKITFKDLTDSFSTEPGGIGATGATGPQGDGVRILGSQPTFSDLDPNYMGQVGDGYITLDTGELYIWDGTQWNSVGALLGPTGSTGATGIDGNEGATGPEGDIGATGATGLEGPIGATGPAGEGLRILGSENSVGDLDPIYGGDVGDGFIIIDTGELYIWDGSSWINSGKIVGPEGATGASGAHGSTGPEGATGADGEVGATGPQGEIGSTGLDGPIGATGADGDVGATGGIGLSGSTGLQGATGEDGGIGPIGATGATGIIGATGLGGPIGGTGATGVEGPIGATGIKGDDGTSVNIEGSVPNVGSLDPSYSGNIGDGFITQDDGHLHIWDGSAWDDVGEIRGPAGDTGATGLTGATGVGLDGVDGATGVTGATGPVGFGIYASATCLANGNLRATNGLSVQKTGTGTYEYKFLIPRGNKQYTAVSNSLFDTDENIDVNLNALLEDGFLIEVKDGNGNLKDNGHSVIIVGEGGPSGSTDLYQIWLDAGNVGTEVDFINSITGPIGATGVGSTGATGPKGDIGSTGPKGNTGATGIRGLTGSTGAKGDKGATGPKGDKGATGPKGNTGATGLRGSTGFRGYTGSTGPKGNTGATGPKGNTGATGIRGLTGSTGPKGDDGDKGATGFNGFPGATGATGLTGATGAEGTRDPHHRVTRFNIYQEMKDLGITNTNANVPLNNAYSWIVDNGFAQPNIYFPSGKYTITSVGVSFGYQADKTQISMFGDGKGEGTELLCKGQFTIGHPMNIKDLKFTSRKSGSTLRFIRTPPDGAPASQPLEDDMDTTITNCDFGNGGSEGFANTIDIDYRGRNLIVTGCKFITGGDGGRAITLGYRCNNNENNVASRQGWKRIMITNNNFHNFEGGCIFVNKPENRGTDGGYPKLRGLVVSHNTMETDGKFFYTRDNDVRLEGASFTGNTLLTNNPDVENVIDIHQAHACVFTGNVFSGTPQSNPSITRKVNVNIRVAYATAFVGNTFILGAGSGEGGALTGQTWDSCTIIGNTWFGASTGKINITNTIECDIQNDSLARTEYRE
jgi:hypothetical protein